MNPEVKQLWVEALESGDYRQGSSRLRGDYPDGPQYCCLGVLCELAVQAGVIPAPTVTKNGFVSYSGKTGYLPREVVEWSGLPSNNPSVGVGDGRLYTLSALNDQGMPFSVLAKLIKEQL